MDYYLSVPICGEMDREGESAINDFKGNADDLHDIISSKFPIEYRRTPSALKTKWLAEIAAGVGEEAPPTNKEIDERLAILGNKVAVFVTDIRSAKLWISLRVPPISDGNNSGAEVQNYVLGELKAMREAATAMLDAGKDYQWQRALGLEKTIASTIPNFAAYIVELDVKAYNATYYSLIDLRSFYVKAMLLFEKNSPKLMDPRGETYAILARTASAGTAEDPLDLGPAAGVCSC